MKNLLVGNGLLIEFGVIDYTNKSIVLRTLKNFETPDFPSHVIVNTPIDAKIYFGLMFKESLHTGSTCPSSTSATVAVLSGSRAGQFSMAGRMVTFCAGGNDKRVVPRLLFVTMRPCKPE